MPLLTVESIVEAGLNATDNAADAGGDNFANSGAEVIHVKNGGGGSVNVTATAQQTTQTVAAFGTMTKADAAVAVPAGEERFIGPFPKGAFNDAGGLVQLTYSGVTSVTVAVLKVG